VSVMVVQAEAGLVVAGDPERATASFDTISEAGREAMAQLDRALGVLRGDDPGRHPLPGLSDVPRLVDRARQAGLTATLEIRGTARPVPADLATAAYRVVQEAVTNTIRHAAARHLSVLLDWQEAALRVVVTDDGRGAGGGTDRARIGRGLTGMRERVTAFGGSLDVDGADGGFRVVAVMPTGRGDA
jgi:signal transduction histidine kinase